MKFVGHRSPLGLDFDVRYDVAKGSRLQLTPASLSLQSFGGIEVSVKGRRLVPAAPSLLTSDSFALDMNVVAQRIQVSPSLQSRGPQLARSYS